MGEQKPVLDLGGLAVGSLEVIPADSLGAATYARGMTELRDFCGGYGKCGCGGEFSYCGCFYLPDERG